MARAPSRAAAGRLGAARDTADWTLAAVDLNPMNCGAQIALYCFEQE